MSCDPGALKTKKALRSTGWGPGPAASRTLVGGPAGSVYSVAHMSVGAPPPPLPVAVVP
jgi:hypothetical protein